MSAIHSDSERPPLQGEAAQRAWRDQVDRSSKRRNRNLGPILVAAITLIVVTFALTMAQLGG